MGLPHRNSSVFKQAHVNQCEVKERIRRKLRIREVDEGGGGLTGTRASEAKGPFPGGKRVGSWGKKKKVKKQKQKRKCSYKSKCIKENPIHFKEVDGESVVISQRRWGLIIQACIIFGFKPFFMAIEAELCWFELAYDIDLGFLWNFAFHIQAPEGCVYQ